MAAINLSPESFYAGSIAASAEDIPARVRIAIDGGADLIDIGAMSTAPYFKGEVSEEVERTRTVTALRAIAGMEDEGPDSSMVSVDTLRASVADVALKNGASIINDVTGLKSDPAMAKVVRDHGASLIAAAHSPGASELMPLDRVRRALKETLRIAELAGIDERRVVLDPGIGFFREEGAGRAYSPQGLMPWHEWDCRVIANLEELKALGRPVCVGLSRKSFLGKILKLESPDERLPGSLAATAISVMNGANLFRTHDVKETVQAVRVSEALMKKKRGPRASA
jgi:dihydropteroate synthase